MALIGSDIGLYNNSRETISKIKLSTENASEVVVFDNNVGTVGINHQQLVKTANLTPAIFNNGAVVNDIKFNLSNIDGYNYFNNDIVDSTTTMVLSDPVQSSFKSDVIEVLPNFIIVCDDTNSKFTNKSERSLLDNFRLYTTKDYSKFNNSSVGKFSFQFSEVSKGAFDIITNISRLEEVEYGYHEVYRDLLYPDLDVSEFNNNRPSLKNVMQFRGIPWGTHYDDMQFSVKFPEYVLPLQCNVTSIVSNTSLSVEFRATPPTTEDKVLSLSVDVEIDKVQLDVSFNIGKRLLRSVELELDVVPDNIALLAVEYTTTKLSQSMLPLTSKVYHTGITTIGDIELDINPITQNTIIPLQYTSHFVHTDTLSIASKSGPDIISILPLATDLTINTTEGLEVTLTMVEVSTVAMPISFDVGINTAVKMDISVDVVISQVESVLSLQTYATSPMDTQNSLDVNMRSVYRDDVELNVTLDVTTIDNESVISIQNHTVVQGYSGLELHLDIMSDSANKIQFGVVPYNTFDTLWQMSVNPVDSSVLDISFGLIVSKSIPLTVSYTHSLPTDTSLGLEGTVVRKDTDTLNINYTKVVYQPVLLDITADVAINDEEILTTEMQVSSIDSQQELELEYEILDLVYYPLYKGINIVPWYSGGVGYWDTSVDRNWNKSSVDTTMNNGLIPQLEDVGMSVDNIELFNRVTGTYTRRNSVIRHDTGLVNQIVKLEVDSDGGYLTLGQSTKGKSDIVLEAGINVVYYDDDEVDYNTAILSQIQDTLLSAMVWKPKVGEWRLVTTTDNPTMGYYENINSNIVFIPYIFILEVSEACLITR